MKILWKWDFYEKNILHRTTFVRWIGALNPINKHASTQFKSAGWSASLASAFNRLIQPLVLVTEFTVTQNSSSVP